MSVLIGIGIIVVLLVGMIILGFVSTAIEVFCVYLPYSYFKYGSFDKFENEYEYIKDNHGIVLFVFEFVVFYSLLQFVLYMIAWFMGIV